MFKLFRKKLNKKGFTLAELLIVVAIVAILVAIAIPIFMNSLAKAENAAAQANIRSVKAAAINYILDNWDNETNPMGSVKGKVPAFWNVEATVENGDILDCKVEPHSTGKQNETKATKSTDTTTGDHYVYKVTLSITDTEVNKT